eukprot:2514751-Amphidinium_carterae.1
MFTQRPAEFRSAGTCRLGRNLLGHARRHALLTIMEELQFFLECCSVSLKVRPGQAVRVGVK